MSLVDTLTSLVPAQLVNVGPLAIIICLTETINKMKKLIYFTLILGLLSCEKEENTSITDSIKPKKIIEITDEIQDTSYYSYDGANPTLIESRNQLIKFEYQSNKLSKRKIFRKGDDIPWLYQQYEYNSENKLEKVKYYINENSTVEGWIGEPIDSFRLSAYYGYIYENGKLTKEYYYDNYTQSTSGYTIIEYDSSNNLISKTRYDNHSDQYVKNIVYKYTYDSKNHYYKNVNYPAFGKIFSIVNNILEEKRIDYYLQWNSETGYSIVDSIISVNTYQYDYNLDNYPVRIENDDEILIIEY